MTEIKNAKITATELGIEHGSLTFMLTLDYGSSGQGAGGYGLGNEESPWKYGVRCICAIMRIVGVNSWEELRGKHIRVKSDYSHVYAIGHFLEDKWFHFDEMEHWSVEDNDE